MSSRAGGPAGTWGLDGVDPAGALKAERSESGSPSLCKGNEEGSEERRDHRKGLLPCCISPLPVPPLLPPSAAGEDDNGEEDHSRKGG